VKVAVPAVSKENGTANHAKHANGSWRDKPLIETNYGCALTMRNALATEFLEIHRAQCLNYLLALRSNASS
jgi:hypothetical protein